MSNTIYTGKYTLPNANVPICSINGKDLPMNPNWLKAINFLYRNTRIGTTAVNGILSNSNLIESGTTITLKSGSTFVVDTGSTQNILGTLKINGVTVTPTANQFNLLKDSISPTNGQILAGKTSTGTFFTVTPQVGSSKLIWTLGPGTLSIDATEANFTLNNIGGNLAINKGGTGQITANAGFNALSPMTTKGDIIGYSGLLSVRLPVGADNTMLIADSTASSGLRWVPHNIQYIEVTINYSDLSAAAIKTIITGTGSDQYKIRSIVIVPEASNFDAGGDRNITIRDSSSTHTYSILPTASLKALVYGVWGVTSNVPLPVTSSDYLAATTAGDSLVAVYSGGTTDYTAGQIKLLLTVEKVA